MTLSRDVPTTGPRIRRRPTEAGQRVLDAIVALGDELGHPPTLREVAARSGVTVSTVHHHVRRLAADGWVRHRVGRVRTLVPVIRSGP